MRRASRPLGTARAPSPAAALLCIVVGVLCLLGLMMVLSASSVEALHAYGGAWMFFERQLMWLAVGAVALGLAARLDYHRWPRWAMPGLVGCVVLLLVVLVPWFGVSVSGS